MYDEFWQRARKCNNERMCSIGNIVKYLYHYKWKNGIEDLKKAEEYLHLLIAYNVENERIRQSVMERK
nr:MAG TPA: nucelotide kinase [Caudoviricetes sp.]